MADEELPEDHRLSSYRFELPESLIAQAPAEERSGSRLLVLEKTSDAPAHKTFADIVDHLHPGDCLVINDTRVIPARLLAERAESGGKVEVILSRPVDDGYICLLRPAKKMKPGQRLVFGGTAHGFDEPFFATVIDRVEDEPGAFLVSFEGNPVMYAEAFGEIPLPPYIKRESATDGNVDDGGANDDVENPPVDDRERYQTVYAHKEKSGSSAAPTAGLHFTHEILDALEQKGVHIARVTLHVGPGTFLPVRGEDVRTHQMHKEPWSIDDEAARVLNETRATGGRVVAVGTTSVRVLESALAQEGDGVFRAGGGDTRLYIRPGYRWRAVDALITNFHLPESTLLMLVSALIGRERLLATYKTAVEERYRFFSYGDACFFERRDVASDHGGDDA